MIYKRILALLIMLQSIGTVQAQVVLQGRITYTRKMNIHRQFDGMGGDNSSYIEAFLAKMPKYDTRNYSLFFTTKQSKYMPIKQEENPMLAMMGGLPGTETQVWTDLATQKVIAAKKVYEQAFLVTDTIRKCTWKILEEVRTIAGFSCRKAVTKIHDSVVVVAFYTDRVPVSAGPEMFAGLPGMILELAIPRLYTTWVAQSVVLEQVDPKDLSVPEKGKKTNMADMERTIRASTQDWGKFADKSIWWSSL